MLIPLSISLFALWLSVVLASQLTSSSSVSGLADSLDSFSHSLDSLSDSLEGFSDGLDELEERTESLGRSMRALRSFGPDRAEALQQVSSPLWCGGDQSTSVGVFFEGAFAEVTATRTPACEDSAYLACEGVGIAVLPRCPSTAVALNASAAAALRPLEKIVLVGYEGISPSPRLAEVGSKVDAEPQTCTGAGCIIIPPDAHTVTGAIMSLPMSGGAVLSGRGLMGMAVAVVANNSLTAAVLPVHYLHTCLRALVDSLPKDCPATVIDPPLLWR